MSDLPDQAARPEGAGRLPSLEYCRILAEPIGADDLDRFLDPRNLEGRRSAAGEHLARMPGDPRLVDHTAWALTALNIIGWTLVPVVALSATGLRARFGWTAALSCRADADAGPFELLVRAAAVTRGGVTTTADGPGPEREGGSDPLPDLLDLAGTVTAALRRAGCPAAQILGAVAGSLGTLARQAGSGSPETALARRLWDALSPEAVTGPGDPDFRRPVCCGLMPMARTDAACCPDCPRR